MSIMLSHTRRGHNEQRFMAKWRTRIAMALAKRRARSQFAGRMPSSAATPRRMQAGTFRATMTVPWARSGVEPRIEMAADSTAHIVFDNMMDMTCMKSRRLRIFALLDCALDSIHNSHGPPRYVG